MPAKKTRRDGLKTRREWIENKTQLKQIDQISDVGSYV